jgi:putative membrane protein
MKHLRKSDRFFNEDEKKRIADTTHEIESRTIGEIAVMVVDSSDQYLETEVIGGIFLGSFLALILVTLFFQSSLPWYILFSFSFLFPAKYIVKKIPVMKTALIEVRRKEHAVMQRAVRAFYEKGLYKTKKNTGVLFFLSLLERKVWVLADKSIYEKIKQETLNKFAKIVSQGIKDGCACDALCEAIQGAGELLSRHFPITSGDLDELPDEVMTE